MTKCAVVAEGVVCVGYGDNNCCRKHEGCDAICFQLEGKDVRVMIVEIKKGRCDHRDVEDAVSQLEHCHKNLEIVKGRVTVEYVLVAHRYTQNAVRHIERIARKRRISIRRLHANNPSDRLSQLVLRVAK